MPKTDIHTIFFSHSSKDKSIFEYIKKLVLKKTKDEIEIFLSSDGQSIPFGRNWVSEVEEGLKRSKLMYVFLTPNSINSDWIYFESGYAYKMGIRVIPIGFLELDIGQVPPQLGLLQGFNVNSQSTLNNIVTEINNELQIQCDFFYNKEFKRIYQIAARQINFEIDVFHEYINYVGISINRASELKITKKEDVFSGIDKILQEENIPHEYNSDEFFLYGMVIGIYADNVMFRVDPKLFEYYFELIKSILISIRSQGTKEISILLSLKSNYFNKYGKNFIQLTGALKDSPIKLAKKKNELRYKNFRFVIDGDRIDLFNKKTSLSIEQIKEIIDLLLEKEIIVGRDSAEENI